MQHRAATAAGIGGLELFTQSWLPHAPPRAAIVIAHGLGEHSGRYAALAADLVGCGHAVHALDHRGHGRSGGPRANIERFSYLVSDFSAFVGRCARQHLDTPLYVLGHSMGGAVAFATALRLQHQLRGLVLSAPALATDTAVPRLQEWFARALSVVAPNKGALSIPPAAVSRDPAVVSRYESDPLVHHGAVPARTVVELLDAMQAFPDSMRELRLPTLILHGTADRLVPLAATRPLYQAIGENYRTLKLYEGLFHEVFNEPERASVTADLIAWLDH
jgi:alpha-beta hydrolase superfamily lysophospholipase